MKDFMFIFRGTDPSDSSPEEMQSQMQKWMEWVDRLKAKNLYTAGEPLTPAGKVVKGTQPIVTEGPFAESKEVIGGFFLVRADSLEEASELAKDCPDLPLGGSVEVREVMKM